eukprot:CAMPEP_0168454440 /NCGR_PEP_ID=MMETSP0228-20121227/50222_1 /TAXON_ID=133427 /ORGANISM="Protoceratium reticulatum, Strain CCCM 535 (=CCMP 1889)" /LENGTH=141 /DNA_ID=CAMNT_0008469227 /DNA_START=108 /DNA_END=533 /DNA_ORIENTATION=-
MLCWTKALRAMRGKATGLRPDCHDLLPGLLLAHRHVPALPLLLPLCLQVFDLFLALDGPDLVLGGLLRQEALLVLVPHLALPDAHLHPVLRLRLQEVQHVLEVVRVGRKWPIVTELLELLAIAVPVSFALKQEPLHVGMSP